MDQLLPREWVTIAAQNIRRGLYVEVLSDLKLANEKNIVEKICNDQENCSEEQLVCMGIATLFTFLQDIWTGPTSNTNFRRIEQLLGSVDLSDVSEKILIDNDSLPPQENISLIYYSLMMLEVSDERVKDSFWIKLWLARTLFILQQLLDEKSETIYERLQAIYGKISDITPVTFNRTYFFLERARVELYYGFVEKASDALVAASKISGFQYHFTGALGRRTRFQQNDIAQLIMKVDMSDVPAEHSISEPPRYVELDDEVRLKEVKLADPSDDDDTPLTSTAISLILGNLMLRMKSMAPDELSSEEHRAVIERLLRSSENASWPVQVSILLTRSQQERSSRRTVERAMMQVQAVLDDFEKTSPSNIDRLESFFVSYLPSKRQVELLLAELLISLGAIKSALDVCLRLQEWETAIACYNTLQMRHEAKELIEAELAKGENPKLWCLMGDATDDVGCYQRAWELSNGKSARAQRHWGNYLYNRKLYAESIEHFEKSLSINSLQANLWFRLGFAALHESKWELGAQAYRRYCVLDNESFEAWNNMARCYCELKQKRRAWRALQEALKIDHNHWRVWDNYMLVSSDLQELHEVVRSYHEVLNIKNEKHLDIPVLRSLVLGYNNVNDVPQKNQLSKKIRELFGRLTTQIVNDAELWILYAEIFSTDESPESFAKQRDILLRAHRAAVNKPGWEMAEASCQRVIDILERLLTVTVASDSSVNVAAIRMAANATVAMITRSFPDTNIHLNVKNKILQLDNIKRSGEEGYFPDLLRFAEDRLRSVAPGSTLLRTQSSLLKKDDVTEPIRKELIESLDEWEKEMREADGGLKNVKSLSNGCIPPVRKSSQEASSNNNNSSSNNKESFNDMNQKKIARDNYDKWDKYDADEEIMKIEVNDAKEYEIERKLQLEIAKQEKNVINSNRHTVDEGLSENEKKVLANKAKEKGNEYFKTGDLQFALHYYNESYNLFPSTAACNNRAMTYIKLGRYADAVKDCDFVLRSEPKNVKALLRRATAYKNSGSEVDWRKSLKDLEAVISLEPNNKAAQSDCQQMRRKLNLPDENKVRLRIEEECTGPLPLTYYGPSTSYFRCEPNSETHRMLASFRGRILCRCNGPFPRRNPLCQPCGEREIQDILARSQVKKARPSERGIADNKSSKVNKGSVTRTIGVNADSVEPKKCKTVEMKTVPESIAVCQKSANGSGDGLTANQFNSSKTALLPHDNNMNELPNSQIQKVEAINENRDSCSIMNGISHDEEEIAESVTNTTCNESADRLKSDVVVKNVNGTIHEERSAKITEIQVKEPQGNSCPLGSDMENSDLAHVNGSLSSEDAATPSTVSSSNSIISSRRNKRKGRRKKKANKIDESSKNLSTVQSSISDDKLINGVNSLTLLDQTEKSSETHLKVANGVSDSHPSGFQFYSRWESWRKTDHTYSERSALLCSISPQSLTSVIGQKLDGEMLRELILCLDKMSQTNPEKVATFLTTLPNVQRFQTVKMFSSTDDEIRMKTIIAKLAVAGYSLSDCTVSSLLL